MVDDPEEESDDDEIDDAELARLQVFQNSRGRRASTSAPVFDPNSNWKPTVHEKSPEQRARIKETLQNSILFASLLEETLEIVVDAFSGPHDFKKDDEVITQGQLVGDDDPGLFVLDVGSLDVYRSEGAGLSHGRKVTTYDQRGQSFGELALLHNCPRAATVIAQEPCSLWSIDRDTYNNCVKGSYIEWRQNTDYFLSTVDLLQDLDPDGRDKIIDVIRVRACDAGEMVIQRGEVSDDFFIVQDGWGHAEIDGNRVMEYGPREYFGELASMEKQRRQANVVADSKMRLLVLNSDSFLRLLGPLQPMLQQRRSAYNREPESVKPITFDQLKKAAAIVAEDSAPETESTENDDDPPEWHDPAEMNRIQASRGKRHAVSIKIEVTEDWKPPVYKKTDRQRNTIRLAMSASFVFRGLNAATEEQIVNAFQGPFYFKEQERVITEGEAIADMEPALYIMERGRLEVFKKSSADQILGDKICEYEDPGQFFGEQALLYDCPRLASVVASEDSTLWGLDGETFRHVVSNSHRFARESLSHFFGSVRLFEVLTQQERHKILDVVQIRMFSEGEYIVRVGEIGKEFYIVQEGRAQTKIPNKEPIVYLQGDYFGEVALLTKDRRAVDIIASVTPTVLICVPAGAFKRLLGPVSQAMAEQIYKQYKICVPDNKENEERISLVKQLGPMNNPVFGETTAEQRIDLLRFLSVSFLFGSLSFESQSQLVDSLFGPFTVEKNTVLFKEGDRVDHDEPAFFVLISGSIAVVKRIEGSEHEEETVFVYDRMGQLFGELALLYDEPRSATLIATQDSVIWWMTRLNFNYYAREEHLLMRKARAQKLGCITLLSSLRAEEFQKLADVVKEAKFQKGDFIIREGTTAAEFFMVLDGSVVASSGGAEVARYDKGSYFGEAALLTSGLRNTDVIATTTPTVLFVLDKESFLRFCKHLLKQFEERAGMYTKVQEKDEQSNVSDVGLGFLQLGPDLRPGEQTEQGPPGSPDDSDEDIDQETMRKWIRYVRRQGHRWPVLAESWREDANAILSFQVKTDDQIERLRRALDTMFNFALLSGNKVRKVVNAIKGLKEYRRGELILRQGQYVEADQPAVYFLESGQVQCYKATGGAYFPGNLTHVLDKPGAVVGQTSLLHNGPRDLTVIAATDCKMWWLDRRTSNHLIKQAHAEAWRTRERFLSHIEILSTLTDAERYALAEVVYSRTYKKGDLIIKQGDHGNEFFMIEEGATYACINSVRVKDYKVNDYFGELALLKSQPRSANVFAEVTPTRVAILQASSFKSMLGSLGLIMTERAQAYAMSNWTGNTRSSITNRSQRRSTQDRVSCVEATAGKVEWTCSEPTCQFKNMARAIDCLACGHRKKQALSTTIRSFPGSVSKSTECIQAIEDVLGVSRKGKGQSNVLLASCVDVSTGAAAKYTELLPGRSASIPARVFQIKYPQRSAQVGIVQLTFPVAPGESFHAVIVSTGSFGEIGVGLAPLREVEREDEKSKPAMVGWSVSEIGVQGDHGRWYNSCSGTSSKVCPPWSSDDVVECGLTLRGNVYLKHNGTTIGEEDNTWPTVHAYPTITIRSTGAELVCGFGDIAEKSISGCTGPAGAEGRNRTWALLNTFKKTAISESKRRAGAEEFSILEKLFNSCSLISPAKCCDLDI